MELVNRVAQSDIEVYSLDDLWDGRPVVEFDLQPYLYRGLVLREKDFREAVAAYDWAQHAGQHVAVYCSADAVLPTWAFLLVASKLDGIAASVAHGRTADLLRDHFTRALAAEDWSRFAGKPVVLKGCGSTVVPVNAYVQALHHLQAVAAKLMYGEPCSAVPLWRKPKAGAPAAATPDPAAVGKPVGPAAR